MVWYDVFMQTNTLTATLEQTASVIGTSTALLNGESATLCRSWVIAKEKEKAVKVAIDILKPYIDRVRNTEANVTERYEDGTPKVVKVEGTFRNKRGFFKVTNVQQPGKRTVTVEAIENLVKVGILTVSQAAEVIKAGEASSYNLVKFEAK